MHILFVTPAYLPFPGGGERYARSLAVALLQQGHRVTAVTSHALHERELWQGTAVPSTQQQNADGVALIRCPVRPFPGGRTGLMAWRKAMVLLSALPGRQTAVLQQMARLVPPFSGLERALHQLPADIDIVHGFNISWEYPLLAGWRFAHHRRLPFVATPFAHFGTGADRVARNSTMDHQLALLQASDRVLVLTAVEQAALVARGISPARIDVISGGVDPIPATAVPTAVPQLPSPYVLFIGRASYEKGAVHAAQAILTLRQQGTAVTLALVGQSSPEFDQFYQQLPPADQLAIRPLGILDEVAKHQLLAGSLALLLPSRTDSFGIVLLEAWAHAKPVIGADAGGIPGVIDHGQNGFLVPFGQSVVLAAALQQLISDANLRYKLGQNGRAKVDQQYSWTAVAERVLTHYHALVC